MPARDVGEPHRQASFLELFFDLCFVVAVAQAAAALHHDLSHAHVSEGIVSYLTVFFSIWWAWMNFTWFASAYDNDDVPFRVATLVQILGALILAAGVERAFEQRDFDTIFVGYLVMRVGLVFLWIRAARHDPGRRTTALRYAAGVSGAMLGWGLMFAVGEWPLWGWWTMAAVELAVPVWAEAAAPTPWHPRHIAERFGLFTIIVLGESVLAATHAVRVTLEQTGATPAVLSITAGAVLTLFSLWWLYFSESAHEFLRSSRDAFRWGYGHYVILAAGAATGAGLAVNLDHATGRAELGASVAAATLTFPVSAFLLSLVVLQLRPHGLGRRETLPVLAAAVAVLGATASPWPVLVTGLVCASVVASCIALSPSPRAEPDPGR